jgi:hypothetical protein
MGHWSVSISGDGPHGKGGKDAAETIAQRCVDDLRRAGHFLSGNFCGEHGGTVDYTKSVAELCVDPPPPDAGLGRDV